MEKIPETLQSVSEVAVVEDQAREVGEDVAGLIQHRLQKHGGGDIAVIIDRRQVHLLVLILSPSARAKIS